MTYWGRLIGLFIGLIFNNNVFGILFCILIGYLIDKFCAINIKIHYQNYNFDIKTIFIQTTFEIMGYISKSKGFVTKKDIIITTHVIQQLNLTPEEIILAKKFFYNGKQKDYPLIYKLNCFYHKIITHNDLLNKFLTIQIQLAYANNYLDKQTEQILRIILQELNIPNEHIEFILNNSYKQYVDQNNQSYKEFKEFFTQYHHQQNKYQYYSKKPNSYVTELDQAYNILNVNKNDNFVTIKKSYYKLMRRYHPDKLMSQKYTQQELQNAKIKTQEIQAAFNLIKKHKFNKC
ncbi:co-chaperone DjlA [Enterobacteriaceae endosymbiont of Neohaemonia nigricornis]|uniref:co-chaperone DjlA n=1 Tax=Enterobacteriaceae endosymbiont of Neohaemonia nigricornis TaxID=2675792 RepID=UPI0014492A3F|nr:co-chaperone DjlA [Enterobacteriaceae endosymbiont of Neohaemonia nigricornis]QJC30362.1 co-chaperone DjlA [Enterobacteriaceae endosymbiont of Neohaemonia nigricornis]